MDARNASFPRSASSISYAESTAQAKMANMGGGPVVPPMGMSSPMGSTGGGNVGRTPARKWYDPEWTGLAQLYPRTRHQINRWCRFFYLNDPIIGGVIDLHAELPHSPAHIRNIEDSSILNHYEYAIQESKLYSTLPPITREYLKMGEAHPYLRWSNKGYFSNIILQNPDFIEISQSMLADEPDKYFLTTDPQLRSLIENNDPVYKDYKKQLPLEFVRAIMYGEKLPLPFDENDLFIPLIKRMGPSDVRGVSLIRRLFTFLIYENKLMDSQISIADNFVNPLRLIKIGNEDFIPNSQQLDAFQEILSQKQFDNNFYLITHNAVTYESHSLASDVMTLSPEWERIDKMKMIGLGINANFLTGESNFASAHVAFQAALARYKSLRTMIETEFLHKFFKTIAIRNEFFKISKAELNGQYRISRKKQTSYRDDELILPKLDWEKKLNLREDESYLQFFSSIQDKLPISKSTFLSAIGLSYKEELENIKHDKQVYTRLGMDINNGEGGDDASAEGEGGGEGEDTSGGLFSSWFKRGKKKYAKNDISQKNYYLRRLAKNLRIEDAKRGGTKTEEEIYAELLTANNVVLSDEEVNFLTGEKKISTDLNSEYIKSLKAKDKDGNYAKVQEYSNQDSSANYALNYNIKFSSRTIEQLKFLDTELDAHTPDKNKIEVILSELIDEAVKYAEPYITQVDSGKLDKSFIHNFLKSDAINELQRFAEINDENKDQIRRLAMASIVLGMSIYYSTNKVEEVRISNTLGSNRVINLNQVYNGGISSIYAFLKDGVVPIMHPLINSDVESLKKLGYVSNATVDKITIENCPKFFLPKLSNYIRLFSDCFATPAKKIIFSNDITMLPAFAEYTQGKYKVKNSGATAEVDHVILVNERLKFSTTGVFRFGSEIYVDYTLFKDFNDDFTLLNYIHPVSEKIASRYFDRVQTLYSLGQDEARELMAKKILYVNENMENPYRVRQADNSMYKIVDEYDLDFKPVIRAGMKEDFVKKFFSIYFNTPYLLPNSAINSLEH